MTVVLSYMELLFFPALALAFAVGLLLGTRIALNDTKRALYWKQRAKCAEGELRARSKMPNRL